MGRRLLDSWESLSAGAQFRRAFAAVAIVLFVVHMGLVFAFHRITVFHALGYAVMEGLLIAGLVTLATQGELARRRDAAGNPDAPVEDDDHSA